MRDVDVRDGSGMRLRRGLRVLQKVLGWCMPVPGIQATMPLGLAWPVWMPLMACCFTVRGSGAHRHGNPVRKLIVYSDSPRLMSAPVAAELWINDSRYYDETR